MNSYKTYTKSKLNKRVPNRLTIILILVITCMNSSFGGREGEREREGGEGGGLIDEEWQHDFNNYDNSQLHARFKGFSV